MIVTASGKLSFQHVFSLFFFFFLCVRNRPSLTVQTLVFDKSVKFLNVKHVDCNPGYMFVFTATPCNVLLLRNKCLNFTVFIVLIDVTAVPSLSRLIKAKLSRI